VASLCVNAVTTQARCLWASTHALSVLKRCSCCTLPLGHKAVETGCWPSVARLKCHRSKLQCPELMSPPALIPASQQSITQYLRPQSPAPLPSAAGAIPLASKSDAIADGTVIISSTSNDEASDGDTNSTAAGPVRPLSRRRRVCDDDEEAVPHAAGIPSCSSAALPRAGAAPETLRATGSRSTRPRTAAPVVSWSIVVVFLHTVILRYCRAPKAIKTQLSSLKMRCVSCAHCYVIVNSVAGC